MDFLGGRVRIPVFGGEAETATWQTRSDSDYGNLKGKYFDDVNWLAGAAGDEGPFSGADIKAISGDNPTRDFGVIEGLARSSDYNTVLRQCSVFASLLAQILAYRNGITKTGAYLYGGSPDALIGTGLIGTENSIYAHIGALSEIFGVGNFLGDSEVTTRTIADAAVVLSKLASNSVSTDKIVQEAVTKAKLGAGLINTPSGTDNGITVTLKQGDTAGQRGFIIGVTCTNNKVNNAVHADDADTAGTIKAQASGQSRFYLAGTRAVGNGTRVELFNSASVFVESGSQINATSFNVPSDRSLKENIRDVGKHQVRKLVEGVSVKLFNYKDSPECSTIGVIAQDIQAVNAVLGDLLVYKNEETGKLGVHESKLVYVLWDYVQQQNEVIKGLSDRLAQLEKKVK